MISVRQPRLTGRIITHLRHVLLTGCLGLLAGLAWPHAAPAQTQVEGKARSTEWVYAARPGDNLWDLAEEYLLSMQYWPRFRALNPIAEPRKMPPGTRVRFPLELLRVKPAGAVIRERRGEVTVVRSRGGEERAEPGTELGADDSLVTGESGSAVLEFADGSLMLVRPLSDVRMDTLGIYGRTGMVDSRSRLERGRLEVDVPLLGAPEPRFEISTPAASAVVRGTEFRLSSEASTGIMRAEVVTGRVGVLGGRGRELRVDAGSGTLVRPGDRPARPERLLGAPDLSAVPARLERLRLRLGWPDLEGAAAYRVQIAASTGVSIVYLDTSEDRPRVTLPDLDDGRYVLKVRGISADGLEGLEAIRHFELDARPEPPATIAPRSGVTLRDTTPTLRWARPAQAVSYHVQLAAHTSLASPKVDEPAHTDTSFTLTAGLDEGEYYWRVATRDASGELGPFGDLQSFTVRFAPPAPDAQAEIGEDRIALRWQAGRPGQRYEIRIARDEAFTGEVRIEHTDSPEIVIAMPQEPFWFKVRIIDVDGYEGPFGTAQLVEPPREGPWWLILGMPLILLLAL